MTRMTGPDCAFICILINILVHTYIHAIMVVVGIYMCMDGEHLSQEYGSTGYGCQYCSWSAEQGKNIFPCPGSRLSI